MDTAMRIWVVWLKFRGVINGKAGKTAALPKFSDTLTLSHSGGQITTTHWFCLTQNFPWLLSCKPLRSRFIPFLSMYIIERQRQFTLRWVFSKVSVRGVKSLGGHFACLCRGFEFYEVKKKKMLLLFKKKMEILLHFL